MTDNEGQGELPLDHVLARRVLAYLIAAIVAASLVAAALRGSAGFSVAKTVWSAVRNWAIPW